MKEIRQWYAAGYARLSKEDRDGAESNSIINQKAMLTDYINALAEVHLRGLFEDDGFSGSDFCRPGFQALIAAVKAGEINCIVVKDLSRFGRNYIAVGDYLEKIFPFLGVRFIAINDHYDSFEDNSGINDIMIPFKNLMNEAYLRDTSIKIRSQFEIKRQQGDFVGAFAPYGYQKAPDNKNRLVVDQYAAQVVRRIFSLKLEGLNHQTIADKLNATAEPSPYLYRKIRGENFETPLAEEASASWTPQTVARLLQSPVYIGTLTQGKTTTLSHKIKKPIKRPKEEWAVAENNHPPIITKDVFDMVSRLLAADTRTSPQAQRLALFSGLLYCADCHDSMCSKTVPVKGVTYRYYVCSGSKRAKSCTLHSFEQNRLQQVVCAVLRALIEYGADTDALLKKATADAAKTQEDQQRYEALRLRQNALVKASDLKCALYEDFKEGLLSRDEYVRFNNIYSKKEAQAQTALEILTAQITQHEARTPQRKAVALFEENGQLLLNRSLIARCIRRIGVYEGKRLEITFDFKDCFAQKIDLQT